MAIGHDEEDDVPTYAYACTACGHRFEAQQAFTDDPLTECPECAGRLRKLFNSVGIVFKGSGFYRTDSRKSAETSSSGASGSSGSSDGGSSSSAPAAASTSGSSDSSSSSSSSSTSSSPAPAPSTGGSPKSGSSTSAA